MLFGIEHGPQSFGRTQGNDTSALPATRGAPPQNPPLPHMPRSRCTLRAVHREISAVRHAPHDMRRASCTARRAPCAVQTNAARHAAVRYASRIARRTPYPVQPNARILATKPRSGTLGGYFRPFLSRRKRRPRKNTRSQVLHRDTCDRFCARTAIGVQKREDFPHEGRPGPFR